MISCPNCDRSNPEDARFCLNCGHALVTRVGAEERRQVTALFADLVSSTALSDRHDPEVVRRVVSEFFERATAEIRRFGGTAEQFRGDAVMAVFGLTRAHEDDPERAVRAAFAVRDALAELAPDAAERHGITLQVRIGVEAGEVVVGDPFGGSTMATGDALNVAARLETMAAPGQIIVGEAVHEATRRAVAFQPVGDWEVAGKAEAVSAWQAVALTAEPGQSRGIEGHRAPLTGRDEELALLREAARRVLHERKAILFSILGLPGVGKSRLVEELGAELHAQGWQVVRGRCLPYGEGITYWPLGEIVRDVAGISAGMSSAEARARLAAVAPDQGAADWLAFAIGLSPSPPAGGEALDREIAVAIRRLVEAASVERPLLVVAEDIHWAEPPLLDLLEYLATWTRDRPVLIMALARPDLLDLRPGWGSGRMEASRLQLEPLTRAETATLVGELLAVDGLPDRLRDQLLDRAEGNPLFVEETIRLLLERGVIVERDGRWVAGEEIGGEIGELEVPETIEALVRARLDALPREERSVLQGASVIGRVFQRSALATLLEEPVDGPLEQAVLRDIVSEEPAEDPLYRFKHQVIRDVAYGALPKARRADLHRRTVDWLTGWAGDRRDEFVEIEAHHLEQAVQLLRELEGEADAGLVDRAVSALHRSATTASSRDDLNAVVSFADRALAVVPADPAERLEIETLLFEALFESGQFARGRDHALAVAEAAGPAGRRDLRGRALLRIGIDAAVGTAADRDRARGVGFLLEAREELQAAGDGLHESDVMYYLGFAGLFDGNLEAALGAWQEAASLAKRAGDAGREIRAQQRVTHVLFEAGRREEAEALLNQTAALAADLSLVSQAHVWKSQGQFLTRYGVDIERGRELLVRAHEVGEECGDLDLRVGSLSALAESAVVTGDAAAALRWSRAQLDVVTALGQDWMVAAAEHWVAQSHLAAGDPAAAEPHVRRATELATGDEASIAANAQLDLAQVHDGLGREQEAAQVFDGVAEAFHRLPFRTDIASFDLALGAFHIGHGRPEVGEPLVARAREDFATFFGPETPFLGHVDRVVATARERAAR
jgi:class 3 adenylate cyclase/tetratricopeptide (TPR) repeat protein